MAPRGVGERQRLHPRAPFIKQNRSRHNSRFLKTECAEITTPSDRFGPYNQSTSLSKSSFRHHITHHTPSNYMYVYVDIVLPCPTRTYLAPVLVLNPKP